MFPPELAIDHLKDVPGFKGLLKAVLKNQIQLLVEQLSVHTGEESIVLSASISDGALSCLSSGDARDFLEEREDVKSQFLKHCLKKHHKKKVIPPEPYNNRIPPGPFVTSSSCHSGRGPISQYDMGMSSNMMPAPFMVSPHLTSLPVSNENNHPFNKLNQNDLQMGENMTLANMNKQNNAAAHALEASLNRRSGSVRKKHRSLNKALQSVASSRVKEEPVNMESNDLEITAVDLGHSTGTLSSAGDEGIMLGARSPGPEASNLSVQGDSGGSKDDSGMAGSQEMMLLGGIPGTGGLDGSSPHPVALQYAGDLFSSQKRHSKSQELPKKRVYRKVECDICHRMIYITNIKVHKYRHMRHMDPDQLLSSADTSMNASDMSTDPENSAAAAEAAGIQTLVDHALSLVKREQDQT